MIRYKIYQNQQQKGLNAGKWFARAVSDETFDLAKLAEHMSKHNSPYSGGVIKGVLSDMVDCIKELLLDGKCVKIDDLAIFGVGIRSKAAETLEDFSLEYQKPTTPGGDSDSGNTPNPNPGGSGEAPDPAA